MPLTSRATYDPETGIEQELGGLGEQRRRFVPSRLRVPTATPVPRLLPGPAADELRASRRGGARGRFILDSVAGVAATLPVAAITTGPPTVRLVPVLAAALVGPATIALQDGYAHAPALPGDPARGLGRLVLAATMTTWLSLLISTLVGAHPEVRLLILAWSLQVVAWLVVRPIAARLVRRESVLVLGTGESAHRVFEMAAMHGRSLNVIGCLDDRPLPLSPEAPPLLGGLDELPRLLSAGTVDRIVVAFSSASDASTLDLLRRCDSFGVEVDVLPRLFDLIGAEMRTYSLGGMPLVTVRARRGTRSQRVVKRSMDTVIASVMMVVLAPLMLAIAAAVRVGGGGPALFRQRRVGRGGQPFEILKFRTMGPGAEHATAQEVRAIKEGRTTIERAVADLKPEDDPRVTRIGGWLRRTSLDELPQLINVLRGDMSMVGPRPLQAYEVETLDGWQADRLLMRPGLTGLWQTTGRSRVGWEDRVRLDYLYVRHWSLLGDLRILVRTLPSMTTRGHAR